MPDEAVSTNREQQERNAINGLTDWRHRARHTALHHAFVELMADYLAHHPHKRPGTTTLLDLMLWSYEQTQTPGDLGKAKP